MPVASLLNLVMGGGSPPPVEAAPAPDKAKTRQRIGTRVRK